MPGEVAYVIEIYHNGVVMRAPTRTAERHDEEIAFLGELTGFKHPASRTSRQTPDLATDFYMLDDAMLEAYSAFRRKFTNPGSEPR